jgi:hypothetical protein
MEEGKPSYQNIQEATEKRLANTQYLELVKKLLRMV